MTGYDPFNMRHYQRYLDLLQYNQARAWRRGLDRHRRDPSFRHAGRAERPLVVAPTDRRSPEYTLVALFASQPQFLILRGREGRSWYVVTVTQVPCARVFVSNVVSRPTRMRMDRAMEKVDGEAAVVEAPAPTKSAADASDYVEISASTAGALAVAVRNAHRRFLVISEIWHPGWHAGVDGRAATLYQTNIALLGLWLEPGVHTIELRYWPPGLTAGLIATVLTCVALGLLLIGKRRFKGNATEKLEAAP